MIASRLAVGFLLVAGWILSCDSVVTGDDDDLAKLLSTAAEVFQSERDRSREDLKQFTSKRDQARRITAARDWALSSFEAESRGRYSSPKELSKRMRHASKVSETLRGYLLNYPNTPQTRVEIRKGRALNWFLAALGPTALDHSLMRERIREQVEQAEAELAELRTPVVATEPRSPGEGPLSRFEESAISEEAEERRAQITAAKLRLIELKEYERILVKDLVSHPTLTPQIRDKIVFSVGESADRYTMRNREESALPLRWPIVFRRNPYYQRACEMMETARDQAIEQIRTDGYVNAETQNLLFDTADAIDREFKKDFSAFCKRQEYNSIKNNQYAQAHTFVRGLRTGLYRFAQAESIQDVELSNVFDGDRIEDLLAYMSRNGFQFAEAEITSHTAYRLIYNEMVQYYLKMKSLQLAQVEAKGTQGQWQKLVDARVESLERQTRDDLRGVIENATRPDNEYHLHIEMLKN